MNANKLKTIYKAIFWLMNVCLFIDTIGQFIPIHFTNAAFSAYFYIVVFILIVITVCVSSYKTMYLPQKDNWIYSSIISLFTTLLIAIVFGIFTAVKIWPAQYTDTVSFLNKNDQKVKIISRYFDLGAAGESTLTVIQRPITPYLKFETKIDTNSMDKTEWIKQPFK